MIQNWKERFRRKVGFTNAEITAIPNPTNLWVETSVSTVSENDISDKDFQGGRIVHNWYSHDSIVQNIVNYAWKLWGWDFVAVLECENWQYKLDAVWDWGHAYSLCQVNDRYHKDIPSEFTTNWVVAVEYCYQKRKGWTVFYWPSRKIKWVRCSEYVKDRFTYVE